MKNVDPGFEPETSDCWCVQLGYLFPCTAWELAARYGSIDMVMGTGAMQMDEAATELAFAVNHFLDGHRNKITADVSFINGDAPTPRDL